MCLKQMRQSLKYSQHVTSLPQPIVRGSYYLLNNNAGRIENVRGPCRVRTMLYQSAWVPYGENKTKQTRGSVRHPYRHRTGPARLSTCILREENRKKPVSERCACTTFRHGLLTGSIRAENPRRTPCGPVRTRTVCRTITHGSLECCPLWCPLSPSQTRGYDYLRPATTYDRQ